MSAPRRKGSLFSNGPDRWLVLAGAGLLVLGLVLRLLTDIGRSTAQGDSIARGADTTAPPATVPASPPPATTAETLAATPAVPAPAPVDSAARAPAPARTPSKRATGPTPPPAPASALSTAGWGVQLGAFGRRENAVRLQERVARLGYTASVGSSGSLTRVRVTGLPSREAAQQAADSIRRAVGTTGIVVGPGH